MNKLRSRRYRWVLLAAICGVTANALAAESRRHVFDVLLDDKPIGTHEFRLTSGPDGVERVESLASFDVRFLGLNLYRYRHRADEQWREGCLARIEARTTDNGRELAVRGERTAGGFRIDSPGTRLDNSACVASYAYWDLQRLLGSSQLLNPQTGELDAVTMVSLGEEQIELAGGRQMARRYQLRGPELAIELWYAADGQWLQLSSRARGDRRLLYRLRG